MDDTSCRIDRHAAGPNKRTSWRLWKSWTSLIMSSALPGPRRLGLVLETDRKPWESQQKMMDLMISHLLPYELIATLNKFEVSSMLILLTSSLVGTCVGL